MLTVNTYSSLWATGLLFLLSSTLTAILTGLFRKYALKHDLLDIPNSRSSHYRPTPKGGGLAIFAVFTGLSIIILPWLDIAIPVFWSALGGGIIMAGIGHLDDRYDLSVWWRLLVHIASCFIFIVIIGGFPAVQTGQWFFDTGWTGYIIGPLFMAWMINLYNFMDGIDGIAGTELVTVCLGAIILLVWHGMLSEALWLAVLGGCGLGFLVWNLPPAKIFLGDAGSGFIGFLVAVFVVWTGSETGIGIFSWLILLGVFLVDSTWTLIRRIIRRRIFYRAHKTHAYQNAAKILGAHLPVTAGIGVVNILWLFPLAALAAWKPELGLLFLFIAWAPLLFLCWRFKAGLSE